MGKKVPFFKLILALFVLFLAFFIFAAANSSTKTSSVPSNERPDLISISSLKSFGPLERPAVEFLHDLHTETLSKSNKDCLSCHLRQNDENRYLSLKFLRLQDDDKQKAMDIYHTECIGCHKDVKKEGKKTGPIEICGQCHKQTSHRTPKRKPAGYDKVVHFKHVSILEKSGTDNQNCDLCHHEYNEASKKLFYAKGKEGTCRYCHKDVSEENRSSMRIVSHLDCIDCHLERISRGEKNGPITCSGCHGTRPPTDERPPDMKRLERGQPDLTMMITYDAANPDNIINARMNAVPFDHKNHEEHNDTCRICHHASLESCAQCHTIPGSDKGKYVNLERAMHQKRGGLSCIGCHEIKATDPKCSSCHNLRTDSQNKETSCLICHIESPSDEIKAMTKDEKKALAERLLQSKKDRDTIPDIEATKENIQINSIEDKYDPALFPHRQIVSAIYDSIKDNGLASFFHNEKETICQGCHHNSPVTKTPPACSSCHGKPFDEKYSTRPGLKGAYHQMCFGCHTELALEKPKSTDCNECHKPKG